MLTELSIRQFRGIKSLDLRDFSRINIFIGENGVGKTSVLEAVSVASNLLPRQFVGMAQWREMYDLNAEVLQSIFYELDVQRPPEFNFTIDAQSYQLQVQALSQRNGEATIHINGDVSNGYEARIQDGSPFYGIKNVITLPNGQVEEIPLWLDANGGFEMKAIQLPERLGCFFIHGRRVTSITETAQALTKLAESQQDENRFVETLKLIEPRLQRVRTGIRQSKPVVLIDLGLKHMLSLNLLGDGFCRAALILTGIMGSDSKVLAVDEIDSGLYHSVLPRFWESMIALTKTFGTQIFCTTHSEEMLESTLDAFLGYEELLRIYRLERREPDELYVQKYSYDLYKNSELAGFEIR